MKRVGGRYVLEDLIASGGMARLHRARDERTGDAVAIKLLKASFADDPIVARRFEREARTLAELRHPGIVRVLDFGQDGGEAFMVLELLEGETLEARIAREGAMPPERALPIVSRILEVLEVCHAAGVIHRDVKPSNVMLDGSDVTLLDFGLAKVGSSTSEKLTETGTVQGTPHYMAPEQCRGEEVGPASDVYSVGVLSYEMLAGRTPFAGSDAATFMAQHLFVDPPPLAGVVPGIAAAVASALAKSPERRPSARAFREALANAATGADPVTRALTAAAQRIEQLGSPREERAIGTRAPATSPNDARAIVWMAAGDRAGAILGCLGTAGLDCTHATSDGLPPATPGVVITTDVERIRRMRSSGDARPVIVVDVGGPDETTAAIRAGADDMLLRGAPDADLVAKARRLSRRLRA